MQHNDTQHYNTGIMLRAAFFYYYAECHYAECRYAQCHYAVCRSAATGTCIMKTLLL